MDFGWPWPFIAVEKRKGRRGGGIRRRREEERRGENYC